MTGRADADLTAPAARGSTDLAGAAAGPAGGPVRRHLLNWLVVIVPVLAQLLAGGYEIGRPSLWRDEGYTREVSQRPAGEIIALLGHQDAVHGLYYLGMHLAVGVLGTSATALRLPSLIAASLAAGLTAALGRRLARVAALPWASATGLLAGLLLVAVPLTTWYAQDARPYALATLCAVGATYLLVGGLERDRGRCWWAGYGTVIFALAMLNLAGLLLLAAHGASLVLVRARTSGAGSSAGPTARQLRAAARRWLVASAAAIVAAGPLLVLAERQSDQLGWVTRPGLSAMSLLITDFAGTKDLIPLVVALALTGAVADLGRRRPVACSPALITLPWLVLPPVILLAVSQLHPAYVERYIVFCLPALALLTAGGLAWLARLAGLTAPGRRFPALAVLPSVLLLAVMAAALIAPQQAIRLTAARTDDLRRVAAVVGRGERPGDVILYVPWDTRIIGLAYPGPFRRLRDIGLRESPAASATLTGTTVPPAVLASRFAGARRLWTVSWRGQLVTPSALYREQVALIGRMHLVRRWKIRSVVLSLYAAAGR